MTNRRRWIRGLLLACLVAFGAEQTWRHGHDYVFPENFAEIVEGKIYRGAWLKPWPLRKVVGEHKIKTVVALAHPDDSPMVASERDLGKELGFKFIHIPIVEDRLDPDRKLLYSRLEEAAAEIAKPENQPVLFHCHHGVNRASMAQMAYRMIYCGWTLEQSQKEIADTFGLKEVNKGPDYRHMAGFYRERVLPLRAAQAKAETGKTTEAGAVANR
jgi:protein tyrosine/serine phosphatase